MSHRPKELELYRVPEGRQATRADYVCAARSLLGVPYLHQGRNPKIGIDCLGLLEVSAWLCRLLTPEEFTTDYPRSPNGVSLLSGLGARLEEVPVEETVPGDILALRFARDPQHVGICCRNPLYDGPGLIHAFQSASASLSKVIEEPLTRWATRVVSAYRVPQLLPAPEVASWLN